MTEKNKKMPSHATTNIFGGGIFGLIGILLMLIGCFDLTLMGAGAIFFIFGLIFFLTGLPKYNRVKRLFQNGTKVMTNAKAFTGRTFHGHRTTNPKMKIICEWTNEYGKTYAIESYAFSVSSFFPHSNKIYEMCGVTYSADMRKKFFPFHVWSQPIAFTVGLGQIPMYIDPNDPSKYYIDTNEFERKMSELETKDNSPDLKVFNATAITLLVCGGLVALLGLFLIPIVAIGKIYGAILLLAFVLLLFCLGLYYFLKRKPIIDNKQKAMTNVKVMDECINQIPKMQHEQAQDATFINPVRPQNEGKGRAVASMVLGIVSAVLSCFYGLGIFTAIIGLILGIISLKNQQAGRGMAITGVISSSIAIFTALIVLLYLFL